MIAMSFSAETHVVTIFVTDSSIMSSMDTQNVNTERSQSAKIDESMSLSRVTLTFLLNYEKLKLWKRVETIAQLDVKKFDLENVYLSNALKRQLKKSKFITLYAQL